MRSGEGRVPSGLRHQASAQRPFQRRGAPGNKINAGGGTIPAETANHGTVDRGIPRATVPAR
jgi:hypothetical protein